MAATNAAKNKAIRQEALREQLASQGHLQHVVDILGKVSDPLLEIDPGMVKRYEITINTKLKLISKYLPDPKQIELSGPNGDPIEIDQDWKVEFINAPS